MKEQRSNEFVDVVVIITVVNKLQNNEASYGDLSLGSFVWGCAMG